MNHNPIDDYIDNFWLMNCPDSYSVGQINQSVYNMLHQLFLLKEIDETDDIFEKFSFLGRGSDQNREASMDARPFSLGNEGRSGAPQYTN